MDKAPRLAEYTLIQVRGYVAHFMSEHVRFAHHDNVCAGGRLSNYTINLHGRLLRAFATSRSLGRGGACAGGPCLIRAVPVPGGRRYRR